MKSIKRCILKIGTVILLICLSSSSVLAEALDGTDAAYYAQSVVEYLSLYARYDEVDQKNLYKEGLLGILEKNPELYESVMHEILSSIDEHSEYYNADETRMLKENITGVIVGIGITFQMCDEGVDVRSVIPDTPASKGGLRVGDIIVSADDTSLVGLNSDTASTYIKGEEGTTVRIGIKREGVSDIIYVDLVREKIVGTSVTSEQFKDGDAEAMYIKIHSFSSNTAEEFEKKLKVAEAAGIKNIIIDLRDNGGGIFEQAISIADMLVPKDSIITTEDHKIELLNYVYKAQLDDTEKFDIAIIINENSASASEVLAAALAENECAVLIGEKSYGKGTIQTVADLTNGDSIKYTVGYYLTPLGNNINGVGIEPDSVVENTFTPFDMTPYAKFKYETVYRIGDTGEEIKTAKELLTVWGLYDGEIDDIFDKKMEKAVNDFQSYSGLYPYGVLDLTTQRELYTRLENSKVEHDDQLDAALAYFGMKR